jgi:hypothetical protein
MAGEHQQSRCYEVLASPRRASEPATGDERLNPNVIGAS